VIRPATRMRPPGPIRGRVRTAPSVDLYENAAVTLVNAGGRDIDLDSRMSA
jgi:hypothetical protein